MLNYQRVQETMAFRNSKGFYQFDRIRCALHPILGNEDNYPELWKRERSKITVGCTSQKSNEVWKFLSWMVVLDSVKTISDHQWGRPCEGHGKTKRNEQSHRSSRSDPVSQLRNYPIKGYFATKWVGSRTTTCNLLNQMWVQ